MKILITGIAGFIGSNTAERLQQLGHDVVGVDCFSDYYDINIKRKTAKELEEKKIQIIEGDLIDDDLYLKLSQYDFDYVFHFAAQPGISGSVSFEEYLNNNVIVTEKLVRYFVNKKIALKMFVNIATSSIYGKEAFYNEDYLPLPASIYGVTKLSAEQLVMFRCREKKIKACSLRLFSVYGPRERPDKLYPRLIHAAFSGETFNLFEGSDQHLRSFTYIEDIVDGIVSVIGKENNVNGEIINLGTAIESRTQDGIDLVEKLTGKKIEINIVSKRAGDQLRTHAIIDKARKILNYNPQTTLEEGLKKHIQWYLHDKKN